MDYEGIKHPIKKSVSPYGINVRQLRDLAIFEDSGKTYLYYSIEGEEGIAGATLYSTMNKGTTKVAAQLENPNSALFPALLYRINGRVKRL